MGKAGTNVWIIAGPVVGSVVVVVFILLVLKRHRQVQTLSIACQTVVVEKVNPMTGLIKMETVDDISTLGDPVYPPGAGGMFGATMETENTAEGDSAISAEYDYNMAYGGAGDMPSVSTTGGINSALCRNCSDHFMVTTATGWSGKQTLTSDNRNFELGTTLEGSLSLFSDENSFERQYTEPTKYIKIVAPPGKLGVVINTPHDGVPVVHAIKDTSVLVNRIRLGDRLISVDNEDTTTMSTIKISQLLSTRSHNPSRDLVFSRYRSDEKRKQ